MFFRNLLKLLLLFKQFSFIKKKKSLCIFKGFFQLLGELIIT